MIDKSFIEKIESLVQQNVSVVAGIPFTRGEVRIVRPPTPEPIRVCSLTAVIDYCEHQMEIDRDLILHVVHPSHVRIVGKLDERMRGREHYLAADATTSQFSFGDNYPVDKFIIALQSQFVPSETTAAILRLVGNMTTTNAVTTLDDGVTQVVEAKTGIVKVAALAVPNPVMLAPYRTFGEVAQPTSGLVLRITTDHKCSLHEADGGKWQIEAMQSIKDYLEYELSRLGLDVDDHVTVLA